MAFEENVVNVQIDLQTTPVTVTGFGTPIFASTHKYYTDETRAYSSLAAVEEDFPVQSPEWYAAAGFTSATPSPDVFFIGRRQANTVTITPETVTGDAGQVFTVTVIGTDAVPVVATYTSLLADTATDVVTNLAADLATLVGVTVTNNTTTFDLAATAPADNDNWSITGNGNGITTFDIEALVLTYTDVDTGAEAVASMVAAENDWYFFTANDHTETFVLDAATSIESREKLYLTSTQAVENLTSWDDVAATDDVSGALKEAERLRSAAFFHHEADTTFPECNIISKFAPKNSGEDVWSTKAISVSVSQDPVTGRPLSLTQLGNLSDRNCSFVQSQGGVAVYREGRTAGGERLETMRFRDFLTARMTEAYQIKAINSDKIPYTDTGINGQRSVCETVLSRYTSTSTQAKGLQEVNPFVTDFPQRKDVPITDVVNGVYNGGFTAYLSGAILVTKIQGSLTFEGLV